jgi:hypothetical protein
LIAPRALSLQLPSTACTYSLARVLTRDAIVYVLA